MESIAEYFLGIKRTIDDLPFESIEEVICLLQDARLQGRQIFVMGNGGSAATASHIAADLAKSTRVAGWPHFRVIGLTDNMSIFSAYANDEGYETVFAEQLNSLINQGDIVIGISGSGNSPNVINGIKLANSRNAKTIGFTGLSGGQLKSLAHVCVHIPTDRMDQAEDFHLLIAHSIISSLAENAKSISAIVASDEVMELGNNGNAGGLVQNLFGKSMKLHASKQVLQKPVVPTPEVLSRISEEFAAKLGLHNLLSRLLNLIVTYLGASSGSIVVLNEKGEVADGASAYTGIINAKPAELFSETVRNGLAGWVVENRRPGIVENTQEDPRWLRRVWETSRSAICIPLMTRDRVIGVLTLNRMQTQQFNMEDLSLLTAVTMSLSYSFNAEYMLDDKLKIL
jgi:D-sedoheptulose 7-phosphate isomerase